MNWDFFPTRDKGSGDGDNDISPTGEEGMGAAKIDPYSCPRPCVGIGLCRHPRPHPR